ETYRASNVMVARRPTAAVNQAIHLPPYATMIAEFVAANRVGDARALLAAASQSLRATADLHMWSRVLAEPTVTLRADTNPTVVADFDWLRRHGAEHKNLWVAIRNGTLLASARSLRELMAALDRDLGRENALVHKL